MPCLPGVDGPVHAQCQSHFHLVAGLMSHVFHLHHHGSGMVESGIHLTPAGSCVGQVQPGPAHYEPCTTQDLLVAGPESPSDHPFQMPTPDHYWMRMNRVPQQCLTHSLP